MIFQFLVIFNALTKLFNQKKKEADPDDLRWSQLMIEIQAGNGEALHQLFTEIEPLIIRFCKRRAGYLGIPEDTLQQSLLAIHKNRRVYLPNRSFKAWMFAIVRTKLIDEIRKRSRHKITENSDENNVTNRQKKRIPI